MATNIRISEGDASRTPRDAQSIRERRSPSHDDVARRAYALYQARGAEDGRDVDDWLRAERELSGRQR
jgi:DUF2934 family protein